MNSQHHRYGESLNCVQARILRAMRGSSMRMRPVPKHPDMMGLYRHGDRRRRAHITLNRAEFQAMCAAGWLKKGAGSDDWILTTDAPEAQIQLRPAAPVRSVVSSRTASSLHGFAGLADRALVGEGPLSYRGLQAARKIIADWEVSQGSDIRSIDWLNVPGPRRTGQFAPSEQLREARARLDIVRNGLGQGAWRCLVHACVDGWSLTRLEKAQGWRRGTAGAQLDKWLTQAADCLDCVRE